MFRVRGFWSVVFVCITVPFVVAGVAMLADGDLPKGTPPANEGSFEGGTTGTSEDPGENINESNFIVRIKFDVPTGAESSPLFGAQAFDQPMLRFEEFGRLPYPAPGDVVASSSLPQPLDAQRGPELNPP